MHARAAGGVRLAAASQAFWHGTLCKLAGTHTFWYICMQHLPNVDAVQCATVYLEQHGATMARPAQYNTDTDSQILRHLVCATCVSFQHLQSWKFNTAERPQAKAM